jgi:hypothetical protein
MRHFPSVFTVLTFLFFLPVAFADMSALKRRHFGLASSRIDVSRMPRGLEKRFDNTQFTFYQTGLGACGKRNSNSDFVSEAGFSLYSSY